MPKRSPMEKAKGRSSPSARNRNVVDVGKKMFTVLEALTENPKNPPTLEEVTRSVGFAKTTVYRLLNTMREIGYVDQIPANGGYVLSQKFFELSRSTVLHQYLVPMARPWLEQMSLRTNTTVSLGVLDQGSLLYLAVIESQDPYRYAQKPGDYYYAHATAMGKCLLAYLPEQEIDAIIRTRGLPKIAKNTITTGTQLLSVLAEIRRDGFSVNAEENAEGVICVGAPVWGPEGPPVAAVSVSAPMIRMQGVLDSMKNEVLRVTRQLSLMLGYNPARARAANNGDAEKAEASALAENGAGMPSAVI